MDVTNDKKHERPRPALLCILDGWGYRREAENNASVLAPTPNLDRLFETCPFALLDTSGESVGLPAGQMGNSEVGHMNLGSGRVVIQDLPKIDAAVASSEINRNPRLLDFIAKLKAAGGRAHLMGLVSPGGVHSHQDHIIALAKGLAGAGIDVVLHAFLDGRDTPPSSARGYVEQVVEGVADLPNVAFGTVSGRYYAMDRDKRWERIEEAYDCLTRGQGEKASDGLSAIESSYAKDVTDEFVLPTAIGDYQGMQDGDGLIMANFRADRAREILTALVDPAFDGFNRGKVVHFSAIAGMVEYSAALNAFIPCLFPAERLSGTLGETVAAAGLRQLRIAETEKYAHVTFFLNGGEEAVYDNEDRILVPSPKVATYDLQPEMSAPEVTDRLVEAIGSGAYDLIVCNYANPDMVGHTGILSAAMKAMETVDNSIGRLTQAIESAGGVMLITADHGNIELMADPGSNGGPHTAHTTFKVPVLLINGGADAGVDDGALCDVAPTMLALMGLAQPSEMTGQSLLRLGASATTSAVERSGVARA